MPQLITVYVSPSQKGKVKRGNTNNNKSDNSKNYTNNHNNRQTLITIIMIQIMIIIILMIIHILILISVLIQKHTNDYGCLVTDGRLTFRESVAERSPVGGRR